DFDGHTITGTAWNASKGVDPVNVSAYDTDGDPANFSTAEQDVVRDVWARVSEDYAPFDVDVTTQQPDQSAIDRSGASDEQYGTRVLIDPDTWYQSGCGCGGVAYVGVYDNSSQHSYYQPALVFTKGVGTGAKNIAEAAAHEAGHNVGLSHDGTASVGYYAGHGAWAPIMGVGYSKGISQWSKGEYTGANNKEDDFAVIGQNGLALRADDHGNGTTDATALTLGTSVKGIYANDADVDTFRIDLAAGTFNFAATSAASGADLDIKLQLLNSAGTVVATADPAAGQSNSATPTGLSASISRQVTAGRYYLRVENTGYGNPLNTGYSTYGSRGAYTVGGHHEHDDRHPRRLRQAAHLAGGGQQRLEQRVEGQAREDDRGGDDEAAHPSSLGAGWAVGGRGVLPRRMDRCASSSTVWSAWSSSSPCGRCSTT
ncbi:zinc-dependent metalloprotease family protein, partial [Micrococcus luteus]|uniref:zinc-dependent metalloprotease family protein n=1 Tax=Micrococcus luteus TaxID=1270 RepID=UPI00340C550D